MDIYYRKEKICDILPYISLNHSEFVRNEEVESQQALDIFRKFNSRKEKKYQYSQARSCKNQYKEKISTHHKKWIIQLLLISKNLLLLLLAL